MNWMKIFNGFWVAIVGLCIARCDFFDISPLIVGFFVGVCLNDKHTIYAYIGGVIGLLTAVPLVDVVRYGVVMLFVVGILNIKQLMDTRGRELGICFLAGGLTAVTSLSFKVVGFTDVSQEILLLEGLMVFSAGMIYYYAIKIIKSDYGRIRVENEAAISCIITGATILFGLPIEFIGGIMIAETVAIFSILMVIYKFGFGIGMCWTFVAGFVISYTSGVSQYFMAWIIIGVVALSISCAFGGGRFGFGMYFAGVYLLVGTYLYKDILTEGAIKALSSAMLIFLLAPRRLMLRMDEIINEDMLSANSPEWGRLIVDRVNNLSRAFKRIEYTLVGDSGTGIGFRDVGTIIEGFTNQLERVVPMRKTITSAIISELALRDIHVKNLVLLKNQDERFEVYITSKIKRGRLVLASTVRDIVSKEIGIAMELKCESRNIVSKNYEMICLRQLPAFDCSIAVRCLSRYENQVSGDGFYVGDIMDGQRLVMLADGMGNGKAAAGDSSFLIESIEELLTAGFDKETSIKIVNSYLADRNKGERFSTLDMLILDLHTGYGRIFKQGASTTFVRRGQWIETIKSTSLPVGVIDGAVCETCKKKFYSNDVIVMVSDGVLESILFENKEDYLKDILLNVEDMEAEEIANSLVDEIRGVSGNRLKDDASIIVIKIKKK